MAGTRGELTVEAARERHAVLFRGELGQADFAVDEDATQALRDGIAIAAAPHGGA